MLWSPRTSSKHRANSESMVLFTFAWVPGPWGERPELLAYKIELPEMRSAKRWRGERGRPKLLEGSHFVLLANPSFNLASTGLSNPLHSGLL